jgi:hypothetical protein
MWIMLVALSHRLYDDEGHTRPIYTLDGTLLPSVEAELHRAHDRLRTVGDGGVA